MTDISTQTTDDLLQEEVARKLREINNNNVKKSYHKNKIDVICEICNKHYSNKRFYDDHFMKVDHIYHQKLINFFNVDKIEKEKFCILCDKLFAVNDTFKKHMYKQHGLE